MTGIEVTYRLRCRDADEARELARHVAFEQTVELPEALVDAAIREAVVGRVEHLAPDPASAAHFLATLRFPSHLAAGRLGPLLNLVYGNVSFLPQVRLVGVELPRELLDRFGGPRWGAAGVRDLVGVHGRPLLASALKPQGSSLERLCEIAEGFARGGGDIVKDDQNIVDADFDAFATRVRACAAAVARGNDARGNDGQGKDARGVDASGTDNRGRCLYFPHVSARGPELERHLELVAELGLRGVLLPPMVMGFETTRACLEPFDLVLMAHPSLCGGYTGSVDGGIAHHVLLGTLFRLGGADISIFPNFGGRFSFTREQCGAIRDALLRPLGALRPTLPCPAGGMQFDSLPEMAQDYGHEAVFLVGGALLAHGPDVSRATSAFVQRIRGSFPTAVG